MLFLFLWASSYLSSSPPLNWTTGASCITHTYFTPLSILPQSVVQSRIPGPIFLLKYLLIRSPLPSSLRSDYQAPPCFHFAGFTKVSLPLPSWVSSSIGPHQSLALLQVKPIRLIGLLYLFRPCGEWIPHHTAPTDRRHSVSQRSLACAESHPIG